MNSPGTANLNVERERRALELLEEALTWPREERASRLQRAAANDPQLLTNVQELLAASDVVPQSLPTEMPLSPVPDDPPPPERLGPYRVCELLGSGGMGRVFRAERADGLFEQTLAIKLMRRTRLPTQVAAQFSREVRILARLRHPHIAQLFDAGVSAEGLSYFAMELIDGRAIHEHAADEKLELRPVLQLFLQVCSAVLYAHSHMVVHADIKPNNVLVTREGTAKLLDFGVARVVEAAGDEPIAGGAPLGITHFYASPARHRGEPATVVDDIYSLGVLLSELLQRFAPVPADLQSIVTRAAASDPAERYGSVDALKSDIERWLDGLPVQAHGSHWAYIASRFIARHRVAVAGAAAGVLVLAVAVVALSILYVREQRATLQAEQRFKDVSELSRYVLFDVYDRLEAVPRALTLRRDLAQKGQQYLDELARDAGAPTAIRLDVIEGLRRLALLQGDPSNPSLSQVPLARANLDRAEAMANALSTAGEGRERRLALARIAIARARSSIAMNLDLAEARRVLDQGEAHIDALLKAQPTDQEALRLKLGLAYERAAQLQWDGKYSESKDAAHEALAIPDPDMRGPPEQRREALRRRARLLDVFAEAHYYLNDLAGSEAPYRECLEVLNDLLKEEPYSLKALRMLARGEWALGAILIELGPSRAPEAERLLADALARAKEVRLLEPADKEAVRNESVMASTYAQALAALGRLGEAEKMLDDAAATRLQLWHESPENWGIARDYVIAVWALGETQILARAPSRACTSFATALGMLDRMRKADRLTKLDEETTLQPIEKKVALHCKTISARPGTN